MKVTDAELKTLFRLQPARAELNRADCLSEDLLARVGVGDVSDSQRWQITDHLTTCPDCAQEFQIVRATKSWADEMVIAPPPGDVAGTDQTPVETATAVSDEATENPPKRWWAFIPRTFERTGFNAFTAAVAALFFITSLSLGTWLIALHFKHKTEIARLTDRTASAVPQRAATSDEPVDPEALQARIEEAQKQLADVQTQMVQTNADRVLSNQELLGIQNQTLQKEMDEIAKPHLDAPIIELDASKLPPATDPAKEAFLPIEIPPTAAMFTAIWRKPADKIYPTYQIEWLDARKAKPLWTGNRKAAPEPMNISLSLVRRNYPSGKYRLRISGVDGKKKEVIDTFNLEVKYILPPKAAKKKR